MYPVTQQGRVSRVLEQSPPNSCPRVQTPMDSWPTYPLALGLLCWLWRRGLNLPQHPEISTNSQITWQLVVTWHLMAPGDIKKKRVRRTLLLVGSLLFKALQHLPTPVASGRRDKRESTQMKEKGRDMGKKRGSISLTLSSSSPGITQQPKGNFAGAGCSAPQGKLSSRHKYGITTHSELSGW